MTKSYTYSFRTLSILAISILLLISFATSIGMIQTTKAEASYTGAAKPMQFYFHHLTNPVTVAGLETNYIMNTTKQFSFSTQQEAYANSFFKDVGLPKIEVDFYLFPNLAGPVTIDGSWQVYIWVNASAYKPTGFSLQFMEITTGGNTVWDSGLINPTVTSTIGEYIDAPIYNYNLSTPLTHTFSAGTTLFVGITVNAGSAADTRIWYDSESYPSKIVLPAKDYARPADVKTYSYDNNETNLFNYNWSQSQRIVIVRANVTDLFGGYDVYRVNMSILDPAGNSVVEDLDMSRTSNGQWETAFSLMFEANYTYPSTAQRGTYTVIVSVMDNNGYYKNLDTGTFEPFIEQFTHMFSIGVIRYFNPVFQIVDDVGDPLPNAQVYVNWPNGTRDTLPRYTSVNGFINFTGLPTATYRFTILWKDALVKETTVNVDSDGPYVIRTDVYQLTVEVLGSDGSSLGGAYVIAYTPSGVGYGLSITDESGQAIFKLPKGTYDIEVHYSGVYWLSGITATANKTDVNLDSTKTETISMADFPPPIWATIGFWLVLVPVLAVVAIVLYKLIVKPKRSRSKKKT
jgi:hypothetical protein